MKTFKIVTSVIFLVLALFVVRVVYINANFDDMVAMEYRKINHSQSMDVHLSEFNDLSNPKLGYNPVRVIALAKYIHKEQFGKYERSSAFNKLYYDQINSIVRHGQYPTACVFWLRYKGWDSLPFLD